MNSNSYFLFYHLVLNLQGTAADKYGISCSCCTTPRVASKVPDCHFPTEIWIISIISILWKTNFHKIFCLHSQNVLSEEKAKKNVEKTTKICCKTVAAGYIVNLENFNSGNNGKHISNFASQPIKCEIRKNIWVINNI